MNYVSRILTAAILVCSASMAFANDPLAAAYGDAQRLAECMNAFDAGCVIALSDTNGYQRLAAHSFNFAQTQTQFFAATTRAGWKWNFKVSPPRKIVSTDDYEYAFVPYVETAWIAGEKSEQKAYFLALSTDGGDSWKFMDGRGLTLTTLRKVIPSYSEASMPLPEVSHMPSTGK